MSKKQTSKSGSVTDLGPHQRKRARWLNKLGIKFYKRPLSWRSHPETLKQLDTH